MLAGATTQSTRPRLLVCARRAHFKKRNIGRCLTQEELGRAYQRSDARLLEVYEHFYADSVFGDSGQAPDTHYVVLAYQLILPEGAALPLPHAQHAAYRWWPLIEMQTHELVHANTRAYLSALR